MGKKKKKKGHQGENSNAGGDEFGDAEELEEGSEGWLEQQKQLLEQFQNQKQKSQSSVAGSSNDGKLLNSNMENNGSAGAVIEQQRRLLEQASGTSPLPRPCAANDVFESSTPSMVPGSVVAAGEVFAVRRVRFLGRQVPVLLQNRNGPCSLLAVANALLLRGTMRLSEKEDFLTSMELVSRLGHLCETLNAKAIHEDSNARKSIQDLVQRLPKLLDGLDVNCRFSGCLDFEYTADMALFDYFDLHIFHVWVEADVAKVAGSWNELSERLAVCAEIRADLECGKRRPTPAEGEKLAQAIWLEEWLEETRSQATLLGFQNLAKAVRENEVCVLFRNNHFTTVFKPNATALCSLLTDSSFEGETSIVWESIAQDDSNGFFLDDTFTPSSNCKTPQGNGGAHPEFTGAQCDLLRVVEEMGFSRTQAEAGLAAVEWNSAEEAVEALLEASGDVIVLSAKGKAKSSVQVDKHVCPTCGKVFKSFNGQLNHRAAKGH